MTTTRSLVAAGGVLWRRDPAGPRIAVVHRPRYDDWSFPKGKPSDAESMRDTAIREIAEETGQQVVLGAVLPSTSYRYREGTKTVHYWSARAVGGEFVPGDEVDEIRWLDVENAVDLLTYAHDRRLLAHSVGQRLLDTRSLSLVRHGKAGKRDDWDRPDAKRPLSDAGRRQAEALRTFLTYFGAARLHSAPLARCTQTFEPYASRTGLEIIDEQLFSEEGYWPATEAALERARELVAADPDPVAVCSQGGVIPDLMKQLTADSPFSRSEFPSRKGSVWVLSFAGANELVATDHYPDPFS